MLDQTEKVEMAGQRDLVPSIVGHNTLPCVQSQEAGESLIMDSGSFTEVAESQLEIKNWVICGRI